MNTQLIFARLRNRNVLAVVSNFRDGTRTVSVERCVDLSSHCRMMPSGNLLMIDSSLMVL